MAWLDLNTARTWIRKADANTKLLILVTIVIASIAAAWTTYTYYFGKPNASYSTTASDKSIAVAGDLTATASGNGHAIVTNGNVNIGISSEQLESILKEQRKSISKEIRDEHALSDKANKEKTARLEKELATVQEKLNHPAEALKEYQETLAKTNQSLEDFRQQVPHEQLMLAQKSLAKGNTSDAERIFQSVLSKGKEKSAEAAYQLASLAQNRVDFTKAYSYFKEASTKKSDTAIAC